MTNIPPEAPINYDAIAQAFLDGIQSLHEATNQNMGGLLNVGPAVRRRLAAAAGIPDELILGVAKTLDENPGLAGLSPRSAAKMREIIAFSVALNTITKHLEQVARTYRETNAVRRADVVQDVLRMYKVAKSMNRASDLQQYFPQVEALQQALGPRGRKAVSKKAKAAAAAVAAQAAAHKADATKVTANFSAGKDL
jgi:hypothetical protein